MSETNNEKLSKTESDLVREVEAGIQNVNKNLVVLAGCNIFIDFKQDMAAVGNTNGRDGYRIVQTFIKKVHRIVEVPWAVEGTNSCTHKWSATKSGSMKGNMFIEGVLSSNPKENCMMRECEWCKKRELKLREGGGQ